MARKYPQVQEFESFAEKEENLDNYLDVGKWCKAKDFVQVRQ